MTRAIKTIKPNHVTITDLTDAQLAGKGPWTDVTVGNDGVKYTAYKAPKFNFTTGNWYETAVNYLPIPGSLTIDKNATNTVFFVNENLQIDARFACFIIADKAFTIKKNDDVKVLFFGDQTPQTISADLTLFPAIMYFIG